VENSFIVGQTVNCYFFQGWNSTIYKKGSLWQLKTNKAIYSVKILIGADGVNSLTRKTIIGQLNVNDKGVCIGYFVKGLENEEVTLKYAPNIKGYIWVMPRKHQTSLGIGSYDLSYFHQLKNELDLFTHDYYPHLEKKTTWGAAIPNVKNVQTFHTPLAGPNWILIGDAAGHVDPVTGEGILYALIDAQLAAQAVQKNSPQLFDRLWREEFGNRLAIRMKIRRWMYKKSVLELYCKSIGFLSKIGY
jgi:flavin-dependent dehydrogenase